MPARLDFSVGIGTPGSTPRRSARDPMRLLLLGDFSGRGPRGTQDAASLAQRKLHRLDLDTLDQVFERLAPAVTLPTEPGIAATTLEMRDLDDFHPDRLYERVATLGELRDLRDRLLNPSTFEAVAAELQALGRVTTAPASPRPADVAVVDETNAGTLERLLGNTRSTGTAAARRLDQTVDALIRVAVAPHIVPDITALQSLYVETIDSTIGVQMRGIMHEPAFGALESAWRGVQWLVSQLELNEELQLYLLDVTRDELTTDLASAHATPLNSGLHRALSSRAPGETPGWALLVGLFAVGPTAKDLDLAAALGAVASHAGGPIVLAAETSLVGCHSIADLPDPLQWQPLEAEAAGRWRSLRQSAVAPWIGLVAPRILLRLPYGKRTGATERFVFEEQPSEPIHEAFLWGSGSLAIAFVAGRAFADGGWAGVANPALDIDHLPAYSFDRDGEVQRQPCAEVWLGGQSVEGLLGDGIMPVVSDRQAAAVRLVRLQSISRVHLPLGGCAVGASADE